ncbi:MAG TPA: pitrilysin family protein [Luteibaculaceae bacterium]|nr:pitrilysin family protein [Luteibaculaceae bacterium]
MIEYKRYTLSNGLRVLLHHDPSTSMAAVNVLYDVGSKDEDPHLTGFAHLFEHLMFGGSIHVSSYDEPLQRIGAQNNAFTSTDITNYYITLPKDNLETALWLESDRMLSLAFTENSLEVQRKVVIEEFKQRYLNQPYGDVWLLLRPLVYQVHPYQWATIGKEISHIEQAEMSQVKAFFNKHYNPSNAILSIAGGIDMDQTIAWVEKWFGGIAAGEKYHRQLPEEPAQLAERQLTVYRDVPQDAIYVAYRMPGKYTPEYYLADLISDLLSRGNSSRFEQALREPNSPFTSLEAYVTGEIEYGLFMIQAKLSEGTQPQDAMEALYRMLNQVAEKECEERELQKLKNKLGFLYEYNRTSVLNKAMGLAQGELHQTANLINEEFSRYEQISPSAMKAYAHQLFQASNRSVLYYLKNKQS